MRYTFEGLHNIGGTADKVIYFDGTCNLCLKSIEFVRRKAKGKNLEFIPLQVSEFRNEEDASVIFRENNRIYKRSDAVLRIAGFLRWPYSLFHYLLVIPRFIRDGIYRFIARNRYRWFGRCEACRVKT